MTSMGGDGLDPVVELDCSSGAITVRQHTPDELAGLAAIQKASAAWQAQVDASIPTPELLAELQAGSATSAQVQSAVARMLGVPHPPASTQ